MAAADAHKRALPDGDDGGERTVRQRTVEPEFAWCELAQLRALRPPPRSSARVEVMRNAGGTTAVVADLFREERVGIVVAGNSGRPGGACGVYDGHDVAFAQNIKATHRTQEEDVMSCWLETEAARHGRPPDTVYRLIAGKWGMRNPGGVDHDTVQSVDYREAPPEAYEHVLGVVRRATLSRKRVDPPGPRYVHGDCFECTLVFVAGPNACAPSQRRTASTVSRTANAIARADYAAFRRGVAHANYAALAAMAVEGCDVAMMALVSGGLYAGAHRERIDREYVALLDELLVSGGPLGAAVQPPLGGHFARVVLTYL